jgi:hypothetical protein
VYRGDEVGSEGGLPALVQDRLLYPLDDAVGLGPSSPDEQVAGSHPLDGRLELAERNTDLPRDLRGGFASHILLPGEDGYDRARAVWNAMVDRRPAIIARRTSGSERKTG